MKTTNDKNKNSDKAQDKPEEKPGITPEKFSQSVGIENYNKPDEPVVTPPEDVKKKPESR